MRRVATVLGMVGVLWAGAAEATGSLECTGVEAPEVMGSVLVSRLEPPMVGALRAEFVVGDTSYMTDPPDAPAEGMTAITLVHQYGDAHTVVVEYADDEVTEILVSLRLVRGQAGGDNVLAGVLSVRDIGAWAVSCIEG